MEIVLVKAAFIAVIFVTGVLGGLAPLRIKASASTALGLARGNAFAGGVFLGAGLIHMLPDATASFATITPQTDYPLAALLAGAAVLFILLTDQIGRTAQGRTHNRSLLLFVVLAIHSVIAGASLGLETGLVASLSIFLAIIAHKGAAGFALGTALVSDGVDRSSHRRAIYMFAVTTPFGIALGTYLSVFLSGTDAMAFEAVFDSLAAGTFIYIALMDICPDAFRDASGRYSKLGLAVTGFALMAVIAIWT